MKKSILLPIAVALALSAPLLAQVEKVAMRTSGISCGTCAAVSEIYLRQLGGIDKINKLLHDTFGLTRKIKIKRP